MRSKDYETLKHLQNQRQITLDALQDEKSPAMRRIRSQTLGVIERRLAELEARLNAARAAQASGGFGADELGILKLGIPES
jgi:hypothetical protein